MKNPTHGPVGAKFIVEISVRRTLVYGEFIRYAVVTPGFKSWGPGPSAESARNETL